MQIGEYDLTALLGSAQQFARYAASHCVSHQRAEVRLLTAAARNLLPQLENQLQRLAWVQSGFVRKVLSSDLKSESPFIVLDEVEPHPVELTSEQLQSFILQASQAIQAVHEIGLSIGPIDWHLFGVDSQGQCQLDATALLTHLSVGVGESFSRFPFAAPESISDGCSDCLSDVCSWGLFLNSVFNANRDRVSSLPVGLHEVVDRMSLSEIEERATLDDLLRVLPGHHHRDSVTAATAFIDQPLEQSVAGGDGTLAVEVEPVQSASSPQLTLQSRLGRFTIEEKLGQGGMGAVYKARDLPGNQWVAIKVLSESLAKNPRAVRRFAKEARLLALARSPYVANLVEAHIDAELCYLVSECVEGGSLGDWLQPDEPLPVKLALALLADATRGLALAHDRGIVHRDIKPDNILLTAMGRESLDLWRNQKSAPISMPAAGTVLAKLADFGIARTEYQTESLAMTAEHSLLGTPLFMAPEQCMGSQVDPRADIYSLGITLYRLLSGRLPFQADSNLQLMAMHANDAPPPMKQFAPDVPEAVVQVIDKCLAKNPDARYSHARELLIDLENLWHGQPTAIGLHPPLINQAVDNVLTFEHVWDLQSSPEKLWPYVAHTDRVNHAMGLTAVDYVTNTDPVMGVSRMAETTVLGQRLQWREHPYEWIEGKRLSVLREFTVGPFEWFVNVVELQERRGGGATVRQTFKVKPRSWLGKTLARLQLGNKSRKSFGRVYAEIDRFIQAEASSSARSRLTIDPWGSRAQLSAAQRSRLKSRLAALGFSPPAIVLGELIEHGSELEVARIRPFELADRCQLNRQEVMDTCLRAAREGLLVLLWDILCPSCRIPSNVVETLSALKDHAHCQACNIEFELDFSRSIEMIFRVHPELRSAETRTYCIGGPAWSRHVVAQVRLAKAERFVCEVELEPGSYTVRGPQLPFSVPFRVSSVGAESRWEVPLGHAPQTTEPMVLRSGRQAIWLCNDSPRDLEIRVERMAARHDAVTAAAASSSALFRELFGDQVLAGGQLISVAHIVYLLIKLFGTGELYQALGDAPAFTQIRTQLSTIEQAVGQEDGAVVKVIGETVVATFATFQAALNCADRLCLAESAAEVRSGAVLHCGPAVVATLDDRLDYFGKLVHESLAFLEFCEPGAILSTAQAIGSGDVDQWLTQQGRKISAVSNESYALVNIRRNNTV